MGGIQGSTYSGFLALPTELRCHVYDYLLADPLAITISAGRLSVAGRRNQNGARRIDDIPGLPLHLAPIVRCHPDVSLLSVASPPSVEWKDSENGFESHKLPHPAPLALLQVCRLVNDELNDYKRGRTRIAQAHAAGQKPTTKTPEDNQEGLSLYVSYPYGVLVLKSLYPFLLKQARRVHISGYYTTSAASEASDNDEHRLTPASSFTVAESFGARPTRSFLRRRSSISNMRIRSANRSMTSSQQPTTTTNTPRSRLRLDPPLQRHQRRTSDLLTVFPSFSPSTSLLAPSALTHLIRTLLPREATQHTTLSARILYPGDHSYDAVWSDDNSPVTHILRNICGGKIDMLVKRGSLATGLCLNARPDPRARVVTTTWGNWRVAMPARNGQVRMAGHMGVKDLDGFLVEGVEVGSAS